MCTVCFYCRLLLINVLNNTNLSSDSAACCLFGSSLCMWSGNCWMKFFDIIILLTQRYLLTFPEQMSHLFHKAGCLMAIFIGDYSSVDRDKAVLVTELIVGCTSTNQEAMCTTLVLTCFIGVWRKCVLWKPSRLRTMKHLSYCNKDDHWKDNGLVHKF